MEQIGSYLDSMFNQLDSVMQAKVAENPGTQGYAKQFPGVPTGFVTLDRLTGGLLPSNLIAIGGEIGGDKTALCVSVASNAALLFDKGVALFTLKQTSAELVRFIASSDQELIKVFSTAPIFISDSARDIDNIAEALADLRDKYQIDLAIVDGLEHIQVGTDDDTFEDDITKVTQRLKHLAQLNRVPVLVTHLMPKAPIYRMSRADIRRDYWNCKLGTIDLKLWDYSDIMMALRRGNPRDLDAKSESVLELAIRKHRNGPLSNIKLRMRPQSALIHEMVSNSERD